MPHLGLDKSIAAACASGASSTSLEDCCYSWLVIFVFSAAERDRQLGFAGDLDGLVSHVGVGAVERVNWVIGPSVPAKALLARAYVPLWWTVILVSPLSTAAVIWL